MNLGSYEDQISQTLEEQLFGATGFTEQEAANAIKQALTKGIETGVDQLSATNGYFKDLSIKIMIPEEAKDVESKLRSLGQDRLVDDAIESMNRAAEDAVNSAQAIFVSAIQEMTISDAIGIVKGSETAATEYLKEKTSSQLTAEFQPVIKNSLDKVDATKYWNTVITTYNKIPFVDQVNPNLDQYVTKKAIDGLFLQIAKEEKEIRKNPAARTTELLKKVFD